MDEIKIKDLYQKFLKKNNLLNLDDEQNKYLKVLFFAGFTSLRDVMLDGFEDVSKEEAVLQLIVMDEEIQEFWDETDNFSI